MVKTLLRIHRYLSCALAPMLLFFAISGAWQALSLHETWKNGRYRAPVALHELSRVHMGKGFDGTALTVYRVAVVAMSAAFVLAGGIGVVLAFRLTRPRWLAGVCLLGGLVLLAYLVMAREPSERAPGGAPASAQDAG